MKSKRQPKKKVKIKQQKYCMWENQLIFISFSSTVKEAQTSEAPFFNVCVWGC